jgi:Flp pilus assembly protein TadD
MARWLPTFLDDQIKLNDFGGSEYLLAELGDAGPTASLWQARGDLYRARGAPRDLVNAAEFYAQAITLEPNLAEAHRGLGLSLIKNGRVAEGRESLGRYMGLKPDAPDAAMIGMVLTSTGAKQ